MPTTTRYIVMDLASGYVWGEADATDPVAAVRAVDAPLAGTPRTYRDRSLAEITLDGYAVYAVPDDERAAWDAAWRQADGTDPDYIAAVETLRLVTYVEAADADLPVA